MRIQLIYFAGCPNVAAARAALRAALGAEHATAQIEEIDVADPAAPAWARGWGSPTILIDGADVVGGAPSESPACRVYAGGAPDVAMIRKQLSGAQPSGRSVGLPLVGAVMAAVAASACCLVPAILAVVGVSGAGVGARFASYRPYFLVLTGLTLAVGFWLAYRRQVDHCGCEAPRRRRTARVGLWITTVIALALTAYPMIGGGNATAGSAEAPAKASLRLVVTGMDCAECTGTIANRIEKVPGVVSATVDFKSGIATVRYDGRDGMSRAAIEAVEQAGFAAALEP